MHLRLSRRAAMLAMTASLVPVVAARAQGPERRWYEAAEAMRLRAQSWGDQPYGAVLVRSGRVVGEGASRVIKDGNPDAHAEREAIRDAIGRDGPEAVRGAVLYSTSRPCALCERAAAQAGVARMVFGPQLLDGGPPQAGR